MVYEDAYTVAFLDIQPRSPGHTVVVSKHHSATILDLPEKEEDALFRVVKKVTELLNRALQPSGFTIGINHGRISGQTVEHLHVHVMPRYEGDGGGSIHSVVNNPPKEALGEIARKIRQVSKS